MASNVNRKPSVSFRGNFRSRTSRKSQSEALAFSFGACHVDICFLPFLRSGVKIDDEHDGSETYSVPSTDGSLSNSFSEFSNSSQTDSDRLSTSSSGSSTWSVEASASQSELLNEFIKEERSTRNDLLNTPSAALPGEGNIGDHQLNFLLQLVESYSCHLRQAGEEARRETRRRISSLQERESKVDDLEKRAKTREELEAWETRLRAWEARLAEQETEISHQTTHQADRDRDFEQHVLRQVRELLSKLRSWERLASAAHRRLTSIPLP